MYDPEVAKIAESIKAKLKFSDENIIEIGDELNETKKILPRNSWLRWFDDENFSFSLTQARRFMRIAKGVIERPSLVGLGVAKADILLRLQGEEFEEFEKENDIGKMSVSIMSRCVREIKKPEASTILKGKISTLNSRMHEIVSLLETCRDFKLHEKDVEDLKNFLKNTISELEAIENQVETQSDERGFAPLPTK